MKSKNLVKFLIETGKLKRLKRKGWVIHGIKDPESVAEHSFRTAVMAAVLAKEFRLDRDKAVMMALIHDLAEARIGDISIRPTLPQAEITRIKDNKHRKEKAAFSSLASVLDNKELYKLWLEFEDGKTKEAKFVRQLDKLEMHLQAMEYERVQKKDLTEFFSLADKEIKDKELKELLKEIMKIRR